MSPSARASASAPATASASPSASLSASTSTSPSNAQHRRITCPALHEAPDATWSNALRIGDELVISGMTAYPAARDRPMDAMAQALDCLRKIGLLAQAAGGSLDNVVKLVVYLTDIDDKTAVAAARRELLAPPYPASTLVAVKALVFSELLVEIDATVRLDVQRSNLG